MKYESFLFEKTHASDRFGFEPVFLPSTLFDFQESLVSWAVRQGRAAIFADCGLGKTLMELVWGENVVRHERGRVLLLSIRVTTCVPSRQSTGH